MNASAAHKARHKTIPKPAIRLRLIPSAVKIKAFLTMLKTAINLKEAGLDNTNIIKEIEDWINNYPRAMFNYKSTNKILEELCA